MGSRERRILCIRQGCPGPAEDVVTSEPGSCRCHSADRDRGLPKPMVENECISLFYGCRILHLSIHHLKPCLWAKVVLKNTQNTVIYTSMCVYIYMYTYTYICKFTWVSIELFDDFYRNVLAVGWSGTVPPKALVDPEKSPVCSLQFLSCRSLQPTHKLSTWRYHKANGI